MDHTKLKNKNMELKIDTIGPFVKLWQLQVKQQAIFYKNATALMKMWQYNCRTLDAVWFLVLKMYTFTLIVWCR